MQKKQQTSKEPLLEAEVSSFAIDWRKKILEALSHIDWTLRHCGCEHYVFISHAGIETDIEFWQDRITIKNHNVFGHSDKYADYVDFGYIVFYLKDTEIVKDKDGFLSFVGKNDKGIFITLRKIGDNHLKA